MNNKSVSEYVAAAMNAAINSKEHKELFGTTYKFAQSECSSKDSKEGCSDESSAKDSEYSISIERMEEALRNVPKENRQELLDILKDIKKERRSESFTAPKPVETEYLEKVPSEGHLEPSEETSEFNLENPEDPDNPEISVEELPEEYQPGAEPELFEGSAFNPEEQDVSPAYDMAIDGLLTASAALDSIGLEKSATISLKLASLIVDAKKADLKKSTKPGGKSTKPGDKSTKGKSTGKSTKPGDKSTKGKSTGKSTKPGDKSTAKGKTNPFAKKDKK